MRSQPHRGRVHQGDEPEQVDRLHCGAAAPAGVGAASLGGSYEGVEGDSQRDAGCSHHPLPRCIGGRRSTAPHEGASQRAKRASWAKGKATRRVGISQRGCWGLPSGLAAARSDSASSAVRPRVARAKAGAGRWLCLRGDSRTGFRGLGAPQGGPGGSAWGPAWWELHCTGWLVQWADKHGSPGR